MGSCFGGTALTAIRGKLSPELSEVFTVVTVCEEVSKVRMRAGLLRLCVTGA